MISVHCSVKWYSQLGVSPLCAGFNEGQRSTVNCILHCSEQRTQLNCSEHYRVQCSEFQKAQWIVLKHDSWPRLISCSLHSDLQAICSAGSIIQQPAENSERHCNLSVNWKQGLHSCCSSRPLNVFKRGDFCSEATICKMPGLDWWYLPQERHL